MDRTTDRSDGDIPLLETQIFTVFLGPDGAVRIDLRAEGRTFARLSLDATQADNLAETLNNRHETQAREKKPRSKMKPGAH